MFSKFSHNFSIDLFSKKEESVLLRFDEQFQLLNKLFEKYSGSSFNNGLYRIHKTNEIDKWNDILIESFPKFKNRIECFGYDWLGRHFALDKGRVENGNALILMLEPGTGEVLEIPVNLLDFHNEELVTYTNEALAEDFYFSWINDNQPPDYFQCVGYKKPLFFGGKDDISNLELIDLEVYWGISSQLLGKIRDLPVGTKINTINIS